LECSNRLLGIGPELSDDAAINMSRMWGTDPVHPLQDASMLLVQKIESGILTDGVRYTNRPKQQEGPATKMPRVDLSKTRQDWVDVYSAAVPRCDTLRERGGHKPGPSAVGRGKNRLQRGVVQEQKPSIRLQTGRGG
jgi:hypothetical protein